MTLTTWGLSSIRFASFFTDSEKVAEKSRFWRALLTACRIRLHVGAEAHVEDAIRFVQHQVLDPGEAEVAGGEVLQQPARAATCDVSPRFQLLGSASSCLPPP